MKHCTTTSLMMVLVAIALLLAVSTALAQGGDASAESTLSAAEGLSTGYDLSWWTVDGGGGSVSNSSSGYALVGTAGQPDAGALTYGSYTLIGGFWGGAAAAAAPGIRPIYLPLILRNF